MLYIKNLDTIFKAKHKDGKLLKLTEYKKRLIHRIEYLQDSAYHISYPGLEERWRYNDNLIFKRKSIYIY